MAPFALGNIDCSLVGAKSMICTIQNWRNYGIVKFSCAYTSTKFISLHDVRPIQSGKDFDSELPK